MSVLFYDGVDHMIEKITTLIKGKANNSHKHGNGDITSLDAGKITSGTISIDRLPHGALERLTVVTDDTARFKLTSSNVQKGDTVKVTSVIKIMNVNLFLKIELVRFVIIYLKLVKKANKNFVLYNVKINGKKPI